MKRRFEWDARKSAANEAKHGVSFEEATLAFDDPDRVLELDTRHMTSGELRWFCFGTVKGRVATVRFTLRRGAIRIYGAGWWRAGKRRYENEKR